MFNKQYYHTSSTLTLSKQLRDRKVEAEVEVKGKERAGGGQWLCSFVAMLIRLYLVVG